MFDSRLTEGTVLQKVGRFFLEQVRNIWDRPFVYTPVILASSVLVSAVALSVVSGIRTFFVIYTLVAILLYLRLKNAFLAFFITFLFSLQFVHPNKGYSIEVIRGSEILEMDFSAGYSINYFFHLATFLFVFSSATLVKEFIEKRKKLDKTLVKILSGFFVAWLVFCLVCSYSILRYSPYPSLSMIWLFQYSFMFYVAAGICYGLVEYPQFRRLFFSTVAVIIGTQFVVSILQLFVQRGAGLPFEAQSVGSFATGLDENNAVYRVMGTFMFPNQLALIVGFLTSIILPYGIEQKSLQYVGVGALGVLVVVLTQSRTVLIGVLIMAAIVFLSQRKKMKWIFNKVGRQRLLFYGISAFALSALGIIPRIILSVNAGYQGAGLAIRVRMFKEAIEAIQLNPLFGYGVGTNEYVLLRLFPQGVMSVFPAAIHMGYLQLWMEIGLLGLVTFLLPLLFLIRFCVVHYSGNNNFYRLGCIGGGIVALTFWVLLPHIGIIEFPFIGFVLGCGGFWYYLATTRKKSI